MHLASKNKLFKVARWVTIFILLLVIVYNCVFQNYEVIGESLQCETNVPFPLNYSCKLDIIDNSTQYWSFESNIPEGVLIPHMMARITTYHWSNGDFKAVLFRNKTLDVCDYSGSKFSKLIVGMLLPDMIMKSNLNRPCPFSGALCMRNFQFERSLLLPRIVPGKWLFDLEFYLTGFEQFTFNVKVRLEVKPVGWHLFEFELN